MIPMPKFALRIVAVTLATALIVPPVVAAPKIDLSTIPLEWRSTAQPLSLRVELAQVEIRAGIDSAPNYGEGGGLGGAFISSAINASRNKKARGTVDALRDALDGYDADAVLMKGLNVALPNAPWLRLIGDRPERSTSNDARALAEAAQPDMRMLVAQFNYEISPDLSEVSVGFWLLMARPPKPGKKPDGYNDWYPMPEYYDMGSATIAFAGLPAEREARVELLAANNAKLVREALDTAFAKAAGLAVRSALLTGTEIARLRAKDQPKTPYRKMSATVIEGGDNIVPRAAPPKDDEPPILVRPGTDGVLLFTGGFVYRKTVAVSQ